MNRPDGGRKALPARLLPYLQGVPAERDGVGCTGAEVLLLPDKVLKVERRSDESDRERAAYAWLAGRLPVPRVYEAFEEGGFNYLLMERLPGEMACAPERLAHPEDTARLLAEGLRMLWRVDACPFDERLPGKLARARGRLEAGLVDASEMEPETLRRFGTPQAALRFLERNRPPEEPAFTHGDYCLPNVFLRGGTVSGFIDLGRAGAGDRWQDIALCVRSMRHNFGSDVGTAPLFEALGLARDEERIDYFILLDEFF